MSSHDASSSKRKNRKRKLASGATLMTKYLRKKSEDINKEVNEEVNDEDDDSVQGSDSEENSDSKVEVTDRKNRALGPKKKVYQRFKTQWSMKYPWAAASEMDAWHYMCNVCNRSYKCGTDGITSLKRHNGSACHIKLAKSIKSANMFEICQTEASISRKVSKLELQVGLFIVQKNLPFAVADDLVNLIKHMEIDSQIQKKVRCHRKKCTALITNVLGRYSREKLIQRLQQGVFSIIIDEASDIVMEKHLAVCVRYLRDKESFTVEDNFLILFEVAQADHTSLFQLIKTYFENHNIPYNRNMVGFGSDGAAVMMGCRNSVSQDFLKIIPHLFLSQCICHSIDLAASEASRTSLPHYLDEILLDIHYYLKYSSKRQLAVAAIQKLLDVPQHKYLQLHKVRWLSFGSVVDRTLEQYDVLLKFFDDEQRNGSNREKALRIFNHLSNPYTRIYYEFLSYILKIVCQKNLEFQTEEPKIYKLHSKMLSFFTTVTSKYLKDDYVEMMYVELLEFKERNESNAQYWEPLNNIDIGPIAKARLLSLTMATAHDREMFLEQCRQFLITLANGIWVRFPFSSRHIRLLKSIEWIDPRELPATKDITTAAHFFGFNVEDVHEEFKQLKRMFKDNTEYDVPKFWQKVSRVINADMSPQFPLVLDLVERILVLPHSSANVERIFSQVTLNKTRIRNSLSTDALNGILWSKALLKNNNLFDVNYSEIIPLISSDMY